MNTKPTYLVIIFDCIEGVKSITFKRLDEHYQPISQPKQHYHVSYRSYAHLQDYIWCNLYKVSMVFYPRVYCYIKVKQ